MVGAFNVNVNFIILQRLGQPIQDRHREHEDRPRAFEELGKKLQLYMKFVDSYKQKVSTLLTVMFFDYSFTGKRQKWDLCLELHVLCSALQILCYANRKRDKTCTHR